MSLKKYSVTTILVYAFCYLLPAFFPINLSIWVTLATYILGSLCLIGLYFLNGPTFSFEHRTIHWRSVILWGLGGIIVAIVLQNLAAQIETTLLGAPEASENTAQIIAVVKSRPFFILAVTIGGPIMEEFVFRRAIFGLVQLYAPTWFAVCVSSLLFAVMHLDGHLLLYTVLGLFFSFLYIRTGRIWTSILCHVGMNTLVIIATLAIT